MKHRILRLTTVALITYVQASFADGRLGGGGGGQGGGGGGGGHHHQDSNFNPAPQYDTWDYDWDRPQWTPTPIPTPHPLQRGDQYRPLYADELIQPEPLTYPSTSLYVPTFTMSTDTPMVHVGDEIRISINVEKGSPPYTVFWKYDDASEWTSGTTTFTGTAKESGVITITAIVKDLNEQVSLPQKIQIIALSRSGS